MDKLRILLVDDHAVFREGLTATLQRLDWVEVVGEAENGLEAIRKVREITPDLVLMDMYMPRCDGVEALTSIKQEHPSVKVVMLTICDDDEKLFEAITRGVDGFLPKKIRPRQLFEMLETVRSGQPALTGEFTMRVMEEYARRHNARPTSPRPQEEPSYRECQILRLVASGKDNAEIADELSIAESTVKFHLRNIMQKLHLKNRVQVAVYAVENGLYHSDRS